MKYCLSLLLLVALSFSSVKAQYYETAVGFRGGFPMGVSYKQFIGDDLAFEGIVGIRYGYTIGALLEKHLHLMGNSLYFVYGAGGHIGTFQNPNDLTNEGTELDVGGDIIVGMDFSFADFPVNFTIDMKPTLGFRGGDFAFISAGALSIRYTVF